MAKKERKTNKRFRVAAALCLMSAVAAGIVLFTQQSKLNSIREEQEELLAVIATQEDDKARLEYIIEYSQNEAYLIQYAREKLGYVKPGEIKFHIED